MKLKKFYHIEEDFFSPEECNRIIKFAESGMYKTEDRQFEYRDSDVIFIRHDAESDWIYKPIYDLLDRVKKKTWRTFKINKFQDFQYTIYHAPNGRYNWHTDTGQKGTGMEHRLLSAVVQLVNPDDYEGGEFEISKHLDYDLENVVYGQPPKRKNVDTVSAPHGSVTIFPSIVQHQVLAVKKGTRKSLVGWCDGTFI
jgi:hypothetical protein